jgi:carboxyvinyl-carboxyphosphonate phosphorylmutase
MNWTDRRRRFRAILKGDRCYHPGSVFDPLSARIAQDLGFEVGMFAGSTASLTVLGAPDLILITLSEFAGQA